MHKKKEDFSYGIVPIYQENKYFYVFILLNRGGYWSFPKGHPDEGETHIETAKRELREETNLEVSEILSKPSLKETYTFKQNHELIHKHVEYYIAFVKNPKEFQVDLKEVMEGKWVEINQAPMFLTFEEAKKICREAAQFLQGGKKHE